MTSNTHESHDRLLAETELIGKRLAHVATELEIFTGDERADLLEQRQDLDDRRQAAAAEIKSWAEVEVGVPSTLEDLVEAVDALQADVDALAATEPADFELMVDRQLRAWRARVDRLRLHGALGTMEAKDDASELAQRLERMRGDVLVNLQHAAGDAKTIVVDLRRDVEVVLSDIRRAVKTAASDLTER